LEKYMSVMAIWKGGHLMRWRRVNGLFKNLSFTKQNSNQGIYYDGGFSIGWCW
jgi:hypothetical protein